ncbi:MAG: AsmA family protein, partial [Undibacterium sp.]|nr:AsmA family protein [Undibacterium sp.]
MNKLLKFAGISLAVLVALLLCLIAYLSFIFDPSQFKTQIISVVQEKKHRTLAIDGAIKLRLFPKIGVDIEKVSLSEFQSPAPFASLEQAHVSLALLPLLQKQLVVDKVTIQGLRFSFKRAMDGKSNIDDLLSKEEPSNEVGNTQKMRFAIEGINISDAAIEVDDKKNALRGALTAFNLSTGPLSERIDTKIKLSGKLQLQQPKLETDISLTTQLRLNPENKLFALDDFQAKIMGKFAQD